MPRPWQMAHEPWYEHDMRELRLQRAQAWRERDAAKAERDAAVAECKAAYGMLDEAINNGGRVAWELGEVRKERDAARARIAELEGAIVAHKVGMYAWNEGRPVKCKHNRALYAMLPEGRA